MLASEEGRRLRGSWGRGWGGRATEPANKDSEKVIFEISHFKMGKVTII